MGGEVWVESELGKGSKFIFTLKAQRGEKNPRSLLAPGINWENVRIMVVDDMTANEAAFVAMRSATVTMRSKREEEAKSRVDTYMLFYYPFSRVITGITPNLRSSFVYSDRKTVEEYYRVESNNSNDDNEESETTSEQGGNDDGKSVTVYNNLRRGRPRYKDYSGNLIEANTAKFYYYTRVMFGSLVAKRTSNARGTSDNDSRTLLIDRLFGIGGNRRYQSARSRMVPSPDIRDYGDKAYRGAEKFKNYDLSEAYNELFGSGG
jgi:hypothetical protein